MIIGLFLLFVLLVLVLAVPALRKPLETLSKPDQTQEAENLRLYQERLVDIETIKASGEVSEQEIAAMTLELDRELLVASVNNTRYSGGPGRLPKLMLSLFLLAVTVSVTFFLYQMWGAGNEVRATQLLEFSSQAELTPSEYDELDVRLASAVDKHPDNMDWAYLQGRLLESEGRYQEAATAYANLLAGLPPVQTADRAAIMTLMVQARFYANDQKASDELYETIQQALAMAPHQRKPLGLAGIMAYELGYYQEAINHWRKLWVQLPAGMEARSLENGIKRAAEQLAAQGIDADVDVEGNADDSGKGEVDLSWMTPARIEVTVSLSDKTLAAVRPNDTVFVLARKLDGPPMPLAAQRLVASQLPITVVLDESKAMVPGMTIGSVDDVTVTARVSRSGQPIAQSGDWQGQVFNVRTRGNEPLTIEISDRVQ
jgi:cytochrome c-type biogenesis protein CcmH